MSGLPRCHCGDEHLKVTHYQHNHSRFHGGYQSSRYSEVLCTKCRSRWRSMSRQVEQLIASQQHGSCYCDWEFVPRGARRA